MKSFHEDATQALPIRERLFRGHFEKMPGPAFIWQRVGTDFKLIAHNEAEKDKDAELAETAGQALELIDATIVQARELAQGLSPVNPGETLAVGLGQLAKQSSDFFRITCRAHCACSAMASDSRSCVTGPGR